MSTLVDEGMPPEGVSTEIPSNGLRNAANRRQVNEMARANIESTKESLQPEMSQMVNIFGDTYNLTQKSIDAPNAVGPNIKGAPKSLATFMINYGLNPHFNDNIAAVLKAFQLIFPAIKGGGNPQSVVDLERKPAFHLICNYMMYRMVTIKMEMQLQNRSSLRRNELETMYEKFDEFLKLGKCGKISKAASQEAFEREQDKLFIASGSGFIATAHLETKLNYIINILNKFIDDGMMRRMEQLQTEGCDVDEMMAVIKQLEGAADVGQMMSIYQRISLKPGGLKVCINKLRGQTSSTINIAALIELLNDMKGKELTKEDIAKVLGAIGPASGELKTGQGLTEVELAKVLAALKDIASAKPCAGCAEGTHALSSLQNAIKVLEGKAGVDVKDETLSLASGTTSSLAPSGASPGPTSSAPVVAPGATSGATSGTTPSVSTDSATGTTSSAASSAPPPPTSPVPEIKEEDLPVIPLLLTLIYSVQKGKERKNVSAGEDFKTYAEPIRGLELFFPEKGFAFNLQLPNQTFFSKRKPLFPKKDAKEREKREGNVIHLGNIEVPSIKEQYTIIVFPFKFKDKFYELTLVPAAAPIAFSTPVAETPATVAPATVAPATVAPATIGPGTLTISDIKTSVKQLEPTDLQENEGAFIDSAVEPTKTIVKTFKNNDTYVEDISTKSPLQKTVKFSEPEIEQIVTNPGIRSDFRVYNENLLPLDTYNKKGEIVPLVLREEFITYNGNDFIKRKKGNDFFKVKPIIDGKQLEGKIKLVGEEDDTKFVFFPDTTPTPIQPIETISKLSPPKEKESTIPLEEPDKEKEQEAKAKKFSDTILVHIFKKANEEGLSQDIKDEYKTLYNAFNLENPSEIADANKKKIYNILRYRYQITQDQLNSMEENNRKLFEKLLDDRIIKGGLFSFRGGNRKEMNRLRWRKTR
jgi:hypothetical protein